jgi:hypothetical protein
MEPLPPLKRRRRKRRSWGLKRRMGRWSRLWMRGWIRWCKMFGECLNDERLLNDECHEITNSKSLTLSPPSVPFIFLSLDPLVEVSEQALELLVV